MRSIFLLIGQSNMAGRGNLAELPESERVAPKLEMFRGGHWQPYQEPLQDVTDPVFSRPADRLGGIGPAMGFARELIARGHKNLGLLQCAKAGIGISAWQPEGELYSAMCQRIELAKPAGRLSGMLVYVGEDETQTFEAAETWRPAFHALVENVRRDTQTPQLPVAFAQLATITPERRAMREHGNVAWERLKEIQSEVEIENVAMVKTEDLPLNADGKHLSAAAQLRLGQRFGSAMAELLARECNSFAS